MKQNKIWNYYQTQHPEAFTGAATRLRHLSRKIPKGSRVVNIGVGSGQLEILARQAGHDVISLDPDAASLKRAARGQLAVAGLIQALPLLDESVDLVVVSEVLEHLDDQTLELGIREIRRVLRPGGLLLGTVPYREDLGQSMVVCPECSKVFHKVGHVRSFDEGSMRTALGDSFTEVRTYRKAFMNTADLSIVRSLLGWVRNRIVLSGLLTRDQTLVFSGRK